MRYPTDLLPRWRARIVDAADLNECWRWNGRHDRDGYAHLDQRIGPNRWRDRGAHIIAWEFFHEREVPPGFVVHHECETKGCVNPWHLALMVRGEHQRMHHLRDRCRSGLHSLDPAISGKRQCKPCSTIRARIGYRRKHGLPLFPDDEIELLLLAGA